MTEEAFPKPVAGAVIVAGCIILAFGLLRLIVVPLDIKAPTWEALTYQLSDGLPIGNLLQSFLLIRIESIS